MNRLIRTCRISSFLIFIVCTSVWADSKSTEIADYLARAKKTESVNEKIYLYKKSLAVDPRCVDALIGRGKAYLDKSADRNSGNAFFTWRSSLWFKQNGMKDLNHAVELYPNSAPALNARGSTYQDYGKSDEALVDINRAIEIDSSKAEYYISRSYVYKSRQQYDLAIADLDRALSIDQKSIEAHLIKAEIFLFIGNDVSINEEFKKAISIDPYNPYIYRWRGIIFSRQDKINEAIRDYSHAIELAPLSWPFYEERARLYRKLGNIVLSKKDENMAKELNPVVLFTQGVMSGGGEKAFNAYNRAVELNPWDFYYVMMRGLTYAQKADLKNALSDMNLAIEIGIDEPYPYIFRAIVYGELERYDEAIADLKYACDLPEGKCEEYKIALKSLGPYRGQVVDKKSREPIPGVYIVLRRAVGVYEDGGKTTIERDYGSQYAITDRQGLFVMPPLSKRPVLPDVMGRKTTTFIKGIYHPGYSDDVSTNLEDQEKVVIEAQKSYSDGSYRKKLGDYFPSDVEKIELRGEDFAKAIDMLRIWEPLVGENIQREIQMKIKELEKHIDSKPGEYHGLLYDTK